MKKTSNAFVALMLLIASPMIQAGDLADNMKNLAVNYQNALRASDTETLVQSLWNMRAAALDAQSHTPDRLLALSPDSNKLVDYQNGLRLLIGKIDSALELASSGRVNEALLAVKEMEQIRNTYHSRYR